MGKQRVTSNQENNKKKNEKKTRINSNLRENITLIVHGLSMYEGRDKRENIILMSCYIMIQ